MPFSFSPGQEQQSGAVGASATPVTQSAPVSAPVMNNGVPALVLPTIPNIAVGGGAPVEEKLSPFAFRNRNKSKFGIYFQFVVFAVFGCVIITLIGLFAYTFILKAEIKNKKDELTLKEQGFPDLPFQEMQKLSLRLKIVNRVIKEHASVRTAFQILEDSIEHPVIYTKFSLGKNKSKNSYNLSLDAKASNYHVVYNQMESLNNKIYSKYITSPNFTNISLDDKNGAVSFKINLLIALAGILPESLTFGTTTQVTNQPTVDTLGTSEQQPTQNSTGTPQ